MLDNFFLILERKLGWDLTQDIYLKLICFCVLIFLKKYLFIFILN
jgi:hypothetical protein